MRCLFSIARVNFRIFSASISMHHLGNCLFMCRHFPRVGTSCSIFSCLLIYVMSLMTIHMVFFLSTSACVVFQSDLIISTLDLARYRNQVPLLETPSCGHFILFRSLGVCFVCAAKKRFSRSCTRIESFRCRILHQKMSFDF